jgi:hypothetical protein
VISAFAEASACRSRSREPTDRAGGAILWSETVRVDPKLPDLRLEGLPGKSEPGGGTPSARDRTLALAERLLDHFLFAPDEMGNQGSRPRARVRVDACQCRSRR